MWKRLNIHLHGPQGIRVRVREVDGTLYVWVAGSEHPSHWLHHFLPGARRREIRAGKELALKLWQWWLSKPIVIGGHSVGGCIAEIAASILRAPCYTYGGKRAPRRYRINAIRYRRRGDIVAFLPPWRPANRHILIGKWAPFWRSHLPKEYYAKAREVGLR